MTTAQLIGIIVPIIGLLITIITLIAKSTAATTRLTCAVENLAKVTDDNCKSNERDHNDLWGKIDDHDEKLSDHATRIGILENKPPRKRTA